MLRKQAYILIGDDKTGKTTFQKYLIWHLCGDDKFTKLNTNLVHQINHPESPIKLKTLSTINRSVQEKMNVYGTIENYFNSYFKEADICILSSHSWGNSIDTIIKMVDELKGRYYNVEGVFFTNHLNDNTSKISKIDWNNRIIITNALNTENWEKQIDEGARKFAELLIRTAKLH